MLIATADAGQYHIFESVNNVKYLKEGKTKVYTTIEFTILRLKPSERKKLILSSKIYEKTEQRSMEVKIINELI